VRRRIGISAVVVALALGTTFATVTPAGAAAVHTVTVTPSTGLSDGQTVTVTGTGFDETPLLPDGFAIQQCRAAILSVPIDVGVAITNCDQSTGGSAFADAAGNISTSLVVHTTITTGLGAGTSSFTCGQAPNDCAILIAQFATDGQTTQFVAAATPISFGTPTRTLGDCIREFLGDHQHRVGYRFYRLLVCIFTVLTHHRPD
jgi:Neocarzinostatin family